MMGNVLSEIECVLDKRVRPLLMKHGGGVTTLSFEDGILRARLLGQCSGCPSAAITTEQLIEKELKEALPEIRKVILVPGVNEDMLNQARSILRGEPEKIRTNLLRSNNL